MHAKATQPQGDSTDGSRPRRSARRKPRVSVHAFHQLAELDDYITPYNLRGDALRGAAPDVFDGAVSLYELEDLRDKGWLRVSGTLCPIADLDRDAATCGADFVVELTKRAIHRFWPHRQDAAAAT